MPKHLWKIAYEKLAIRTSSMRGKLYVCFRPETLKCTLRLGSYGEGRGATKEEDLWLIEHIWLFKSAVDALEMLKQYPQVMDRMLLLTGHDKESFAIVGKEDADEYGSDCNESADQSCENDPDRFGEPNDR